MRHWQVAAACAVLMFAPLSASAQNKPVVTPRFEPQPLWPKPLPSNWILGQVAGIAVGPDDHIWIIHRPATLLDDEKGAQSNPPSTTCCTAAPPALEFDADGNLLRSWGGKAAMAGTGHDWPKNEHGIFIDKAGDVWLGGNDNGDQIYKFAPDGKFIMQVGKDDSSKGSNSTTRLGRPAHMMVDETAGELYVADGYGNRRVIVFDAKTGAYKRHWGAYGNTPSDDAMPAYRPDAKLSDQFSNPVHCVRLSNDGLLYVCDRANDRIQVFRKDGAFVKEFRVVPQTLANGSAWDLVLSNDPAQQFIFMADGANGQVVTLNRETGDIVTAWGRHGRQPGQFKWVHNIAIDSKGNLYTSEVGWGRRAQKFLRVE